VVSILCFKEMSRISQRFNDWVKRHNVKAGTRCKVLRVHEPGERGYTEVARVEHALLVGETVTIGRLYYDEGDVDVGGLFFPYFVLKVIEPPPQITDRF
jgi:hypothetical protein